MNAESALKQTGDIMKARWSEGIMIVGMQTGMMVMLERLLVVGGVDPSRPATIPDWALFLLGIGSAVLAVIWQMLYLGFLRTAALNGTPSHEPMALLMNGRIFFWRFLGVQVVMGVGLWFITGMVAALAGWLLGFREASVLPQWLLEVSGIAAIAIFIKPFFLLPAFILALNASAMEAFALMKQFRLSDLGVLLKAYALGLIAIAVAAVMTTLAPKGTAVYHIAAGASFLTQSLIILALMLATTLFLTPEAKQDTEEE